MKELIDRVYDYLMEEESKGVTRLECWAAVIGLALVLVVVEIICRSI